MASWKWFGIAHKTLYRLSGGRLGARMGWIDVALVETIGRKSGQPRVVPIACYPYKGSIVVSASNGGSEQHPAWYLNMVANPQVNVQCGKKRYRACAEAVPEAERPALWQQITAANHHQQNYLDATRREIPLMWLRPLDEAAAS